MRRTLVASLVVAMALAAFSGAQAQPAARCATRPEERASSGGATYVVLPGDHVTRIARRVGLSREAVTDANPELRMDRLRPGQRLRIPGATRVVDHPVREGETVARLARRYRVSPRDLLAWNPSVATRGLHAGTTLRIYTDVRISPSESVGAVNDGRLLHGERLPAHPGYEIRNVERAFGTEETITWIVEAFEAVLAADPRTPRVRVHDLSQARGGRMTDHRSHQSGRDADVAYYRRSCRRSSPCLFERTRPNELDAARTWRLFHAWLSRDVVDSIFVDYALQAPLYEEARRTGATREQLERWFQYPRGPGNPHGRIRHFAKHADHFHVRFVCPEADDACQERPHASD